MRFISLFDVLTHCAAVHLRDPLLRRGVECRRAPALTAELTAAPTWPRCRGWMVGWLRCRLGAWLSLSSLPTVPLRGPGRRWEASRRDLTDCLAFLRALCRAAPVLPLCPSLFLSLSRCLLSWFAARSLPCCRRHTLQSSTSICRLGYVTSA